MSSSKKGYLKQNRERIVDETLFEIKDVKDYSVLYTAILEDVDILVTRDSDFSDVMLKNRSFDTCGVLEEMFW